MDPQPETSKRISRPAGACQAEPERFVFKSVPHPSGARPFSCSRAVGRGWPRTDHTMRELPGGRRTPQSPAPGAQTPWNSPAMRESPRIVDPGRRPAGPPASLQDACRDHATPPHGSRPCPVLRRPHPFWQPAHLRTSPPGGLAAIWTGGPRPVRSVFSRRSEPAAPPAIRETSAPFPGIPETPFSYRMRAARGSGPRSARLRRGPPCCLPPWPTTPLPPAAARPAEAPDSGFPSHRVTPSSCRPSLRQHTGNSADATSTRSNSSPSPRTAAFSSLIRPKIPTSRTCAGRPIYMYGN